jgi:hypothetical protein
VDDIFETLAKQVSCPLHNQLPSIHETISFVEAKRVSRDRRESPDAVLLFGLRMNSILSRKKLASDE